MDAMTICVLHVDGLIKMVSIDCTDMSRVLKTTRDLRLQGVMAAYLGVVRFKDNLVVCGVKHDMIYWCVVSLHDGHVDTIHQICKWDRGCWCRVTTKDNIVYVACSAGFGNTGVYGFDILNPSKCKYKYKHQRLQDPTSIVVNEDGNIFVCNGVPSCIHQLTASCQLVAIFTQGIPWYPRAIFWDNGCLYAACYESRDITVFTHLYQGNHEDSEVGTSIKIEQGNVDKVLSSVKTEMPPSVPDPDNSEDEKQDYNASDIITSDERKPAFEETSTQIIQEIPIEQIVEERLSQAEIQMEKEERDLFLRFHHEIGTTLHFSKDQQTLIDVQKSLQATEMFIEQSRPDMKDEWLEYKNQGKLTPKLIDVFCAEERNRKLHIYKCYFLNKMEKLNILIRGRSFNENGVKEEDFYFTPCMLRKEAPREVIAPEKDARMVSTSVLCWVIIGNFMPPAIFQKLIAACLARWPVAKKKKTSENLIFQNCTVFDLDPVHRLFLHFENHTVFARITRMGIDDIINAKICTRVRKFITLNISEIISHLDPNLKYRLCVQYAESQDIPEDIRSCVSPPFEMWFVDEVHDLNAPITREQMNHARLCVALVTVCGKAMRDILQANVPAPHTSICEAILANRTKLIGRTENGSGKGQNPLLNNYQCKMLFPDPKHQYMASIDEFDISLLYALIRNLSKVQPPSTNWGVAPQDKPRNKSLGANVERIHIYRNELCGHSVDGQISQDDFKDYWKKLVLVLSDLDNEIGRQEYCQELDKQKRQVTSVYEAC